MKSKEKITQILKWVQTANVDWNFLRALKEDLEDLSEIAKAEGVDNLVSNELNRLFRGEMHE